jgi:hypothetical protein
MKNLSPSKVLQQVTEVVPSEYLQNLIVVGSLAAAYHFFRKDEGREVRTKDVDCLLCPHERAVESGVAMTEKMIAEGWQHRIEGGFGIPQPSAEPTDKLSAIRLCPPNSKDWFAELLAVPASEESVGKSWVAIELQSGFFGLPTFEFMSLTAFRAMPTEFGIRYARPEMMALANLLSHPVIAADTMSSPYGDRTIKRSNKDLGRVLSLARLSSDDEIVQWPSKWEEALRDCFPNRWADLAASVGGGFRQLLDSDQDFDEAHHTCVVGLLASQPTTIEQLKATGQRVLQDAIEPLESLGLAALQ